MHRDTSGCTRCKGADTICTDSTLTRETRYCFACRRSFDVDLSGPPDRQRRRDDYPNDRQAIRR